MVQHRAQARDLTYRTACIWHQSNQHQLLIYLFETSTLDSLSPSDIASLWRNVPWTTSQWHIWLSSSSTQSIDQRHPWSNLQQVSVAKPCLRPSSSEALNWDCMPEVCSEVWYERSLVESMSKALKSKYGSTESCSGQWIPVDMRSLPMLFAKFGRGSKFASGLKTKMSSQSWDSVEESKSYWPKELATGAQASSLIPADTAGHTIPQQDIVSGRWTKLGGSVRGRVLVQDLVIRCVWMEVVMDVRGLVLWHLQMKSQCHMVVEWMWRLREDRPFREPLSVEHSLLLDLCFVVRVLLVELSVFASICRLLFCFVEFVRFFVVLFLLRSWLASLVEELELCLVLVVPLFLLGNIESTLRYNLPSFPLLLSRFTLNRNIITCFRWRCRCKIVVRWWFIVRHVDRCELTGVKICVHFGWVLKDVRCDKNWKWLSVWMV